MWLIFINQPTTISSPFFQAQTNPKQPPWTNHVPTKPKHWNVLKDHLEDLKRWTLIQSFLGDPPELQVATFEVDPLPWRIWPTKNPQGPGAPAIQEFDGGSRFCVRINNVTLDPWVGCHNVKIH